MSFAARAPSAPVPESHFRTLRFRASRCPVAYAPEMGLPT